MQLPAITALLCTLAALGSNAVAADLSARVDSAAHEAEIRLNNKRLLRYVYGPQQFKPYIKELATVDGENVLLDAPPDHLHHHGLMYAIRVNGINFWEETATAGLQKPVGPPMALPAPAAGKLRSAGITQTIYWVPASASNQPPNKAAALLIENRRIELGVDEAQGEVRVEWRSDFTTGTGTNKYVLSGSGYNGLGLRPIPAFNMVAKRLNPGNLPYSADAKWDVLGGTWGALVGKVGESEATITMFNHPENKAEPLFFSMLNPFAYLAGTQGLDKQVIEYPANTKFSVRYLVTVHKGARTVEQLNELGKARGFAK